MKGEWRSLSQKSSKWKRNLYGYLCLRSWIFRQVRFQGPVWNTSYHLINAKRPSGDKLQCLQCLFCVETLKRLPKCMTKQIQTDFFCFYPSIYVFITTITEKITPYKDIYIYTYLIHVVFIIVYGYVFQLFYMWIFFACWAMMRAWSVELTYKAGSDGGMTGSIFKPELLRLLLRNKTVSNKVRAIPGPYITFYRRTTSP